MRRFFRFFFRPLPPGFTPISVTFRALTIAPHAPPIRTELSNRVKKRSLTPFRFTTKPGKTYGVLKSVPAFLKESGETFAEIDRKNIAALDKIYHPSVYSYRDYLAGVLAKVRTKEGKTYVFDGNDFVAGKIALALSPTSGSSSLVLVQVAEALKSGFVADSIAVNYGTADELISFAKAYVLSPREGLSQVYAALVYARFIKALDDKFALTDSQKSATKIEYNGSVLTPSKYYDALLVGYVK